MTAMADLMTHLSDMQLHLRSAHKHAIIHGFPDVAGELQQTMRTLEERYWAAQERAMALTAKAAPVYLRALNSSGPPM